MWGTLLIWHWVMAVMSALKILGPDKDAVGLFSDSLLLLPCYGALEATEFLAMQRRCCKLSVGPLSLRDVVEVLAEAATAHPSFTFLRMLSLPYSTLDTSKGWLLRV